MSVSKDLDGAAGSIIIVLSIAATADDGDVSGERIYTGSCLAEIGEA